MSLINNDGVVLFEQWIRLRFGQQNAIGHQFDATALFAVVTKADLETDQLAQCALQLFGNAGGNCTGGNAARLCVSNLLFCATPQC